jgi:hypothetical protein
MVCYVDGVHRFVPPSSWPANHTKKNSTDIMCLKSLEGSTAPPMKASDPSQRLC